MLDIEKVVESVGKQIKSKANQIINNKVNDDYKTNENYNDMCKNVVSEDDTLKIDTLEPVSYTHLDVYKRQVEIDFNSFW